MAKYWKLRRPALLIAVTGGAASFKLSERLEQAFSRGLYAVTQSAKTIILTGGMSSGVMALVGSAFAQAPHPPPVIGFAPWSKVLGRRFLVRRRQSNPEGRVVPSLQQEGNAVSPRRPSQENNHGESEPRVYMAGEQNGPHGAGLEWRHSHFVLVDAGKDSDWGAEISLRDAAQQTFATLYSVPREDELAV